MPRFVTYFEALSPGMKARLDPNFRLFAQREPDYEMSISKKDGDIPQSSRTAPATVKREPSRY